MVTMERAHRWAFHLSDSNDESPEEAARSHTGRIVRKRAAAWCTESSGVENTADARTSVLRIFDSCNCSSDDDEMP